MSFLDRLGLSRTPIVDKNGVTTSRWKRQRVQIDPSTPVPGVSTVSAHPNTPAQIGAHKITKHLKHHRSRQNAGESLVRYMRTLEDAEMTKVETMSNEGNKAASVALAVSVLREEGQTEDAALVRRLSETYPCLGIGRHRLTFDAGDWVVKVPFRAAGRTTNRNEADWFQGARPQKSPQEWGYIDPETQVAECEIAELEGVKVLIMEKVSSVPAGTELPSWAARLDHGQSLEPQVGLNATGEIVAFDL